MTPVPITVLFRQTQPLGCDPQALVRALQSYSDHLLGPVWSVGCALTVGSAVPPGGYGLVFADDSDAPGAIGYHDDPDGAGPRPPVGYVFVRTAARISMPVSVVASHELAELLVNPACNRGVLSPRGRWIALEPCDPVQAGTFLCEGLPVSDFAYPAWYGSPGDKYDHLGLCLHPWEIRPGGYVPYWQNGGWSQLFGSALAEERWHAKHHHRLLRARTKTPVALVATTGATQERALCC